MLEDLVSRHQARHFSLGSLRKRLARHQSLDKPSPLTSTARQVPQASPVQQLQAEQSRLTPVALVLVPRRALSRRSRSTSVVKVAGRQVKLSEQMIVSAIVPVLQEAFRRSLERRLRNRSRARESQSRDNSLDSRCRVSSLGKVSQFLGSNLSRVNLSRVSFSQDSFSQGNRNQGNLSQARPNRSSHNRNSKDPFLQLYPLRSPHPPACLQPSPLPRWRNRSSQGLVPVSVENQGMDLQLATSRLRTGTLYRCRAL
jgi:hypothetical protein